MHYRDIIVEAASASKAYLAGLIAHDQQARSQFQAFVGKYPSWEEGTQAWVQQRNADPNDVFGEKPQLAQFIQQSKTFQYQMFDQDDWHNFWLLTQHCDFNRPFQTWALKVITQYLGTNSEEYKYLSDRISCATTGTQKYGTQDVCQVRQAG